MDQTQQNGKTSNVGVHGQSELAHDRERLMNDLKSAIGDAEQWLTHAGSSAAASADEVKAKFQDTLRTAKTDLLKLEDSVLARGKLAARATDAYVHDNPWKSVGLVAAAGIVVGMLIARK